MILDFRFIYRVYHGRDEKSTDNSALTQFALGHRIIWRLADLKAMNEETIVLSRLPRGQSARVMYVMTGTSLRRRLLDLGLIPGTEVACLGASPLGDPRTYLVRGKMIAIRARDAVSVVVGR